MPTESQMTANIARSLECNAHQLRAHGLLLPATLAYTHAITAWGEMKEASREAACRLSLGDVHRIRGNLSDAHDQYDRGQDLYLEIDDEAGIYRSAQCFGDLECARGDFGAALVSYTHALDGYLAMPSSSAEDLGFNSQLAAAGVLCSIGDVRLAVHHVPTAAAHYQRAQELDGGTLGAQCHAHALTGMARVFLAEGNTSRARALTQQAADLLSSCEDTIGPAVVNTVRGDIERTLFRYEVADEVYVRAEGVFREVGSVCHTSLIVLRRLGARMIGWDSPQMSAARARMDELVGRPIAVDEVSAWPMEFHLNSFHDSPGAK